MPWRGASDRRSGTGHVTGALARAHAYIGSVKVKLENNGDSQVSIADRLEELLNWFYHRRSNGVAEGMNSIYKRIKAAA